MQILPGESVLSNGVPPLEKGPDGEDVDDEDDVDPKVDVETVLVPWTPFRLEELRTDRVTSRPTDD